MQGTILRGIGGFYYAMDEGGQVHTLRAQGKIRREHLKPKVGDRVEISPGEGEEHGWIHHILPRRNELTRPPVANVDLILIVVAAVTPDPDLMMVDRLMMNARRAGMDVRLAINKCDLNREQAAEIARQYRGAMVSPIAISARTGEGLEVLREALKGLVFTLAGQSGAGKSTLANALYGLDQETGALSQRIERGRNTTRHCELIPVPGGGMVLDTPGFSLLETEVFDPVELKDSYPEFAPFEGMCYFQPCYHATEPKCAVRDAVDREEIDRRRHERYAAILEDLKLRWRDRYD